MSTGNEKGVKTMSAATTIQKWGNSLAVRIPTQIAEKISFKQGIEIQLEVIDDKELRVVPKKKAPTLDELLAKITPENRHRELDFGVEGNELI